MLLDLSSCLSEPSRGLNPNTFVQVSTSSVIAGMINFSTFRELRAFENKLINSRVIIGKKKNYGKRKTTNIKLAIPIQFHLGGDGTSLGACTCTASL